MYTTFLYYTLRVSEEFPRKFSFLILFGNGFEHEEFKFNFIENKNIHY